jgi:hypothetical protein
MIRLGKLRKRLMYIAGKPINSITQLVPAVSLLCRSQLHGMKNNPIPFIRCRYFAKSDYANHPGDESWVFVTNIILIKPISPSYGYAITLTKGINEKWSGFIENRGYKSDFYSDAILRGGAAFTKQGLAIDASISRN